MTALSMWYYLTLPTNNNVTSKLTIFAQFFYFDYKFTLAQQFVYVLEIGALLL